jgi:hypothetical protein
LIVYSILFAKQIPRRSSFIPLNLRKGIANNRSEVLDKPSIDSYSMFAKREQDVFQQVASSSPKVAVVERGEEVLHELFLVQVLAA